MSAGMAKALGAWWFGIAALLFTSAAQAHKPSDAYMQLQVNGAEVEQRFDIALRDLERELALDADDNGQLEWREVRSRWADIAEMALQGASLQADGRACSAGPAGTPQLDEHSDGRYAVLMRRWTCPAPVQNLDVAYTLFRQTDPTHRGVVRLLQRGGDAPALLVPGSTPHRFALSASGAAGDSHPPTSGFFGFFKEGVHHILIGSDHILFLLALLLPAVLMRRDPRQPPSASAPPSSPPTHSSPERSAPALATFRAGAVSGSAAAAQRGAVMLAGPRADPVAAAPLGPGRPSDWQPAPALKPVLLDILRVVTAFTVAHSITLALAALDIVNPPSRWIESIIAASVVLAALNNLYPVVREGRWKLTFVFGLVHGFGFASALKDVGLTQGDLVAPLLGFNLGVEGGQIAIVLLFLAIVWPLRRTGFYRHGLFKLGSVAIALLALGWLVERAFDVKLPLPL